MDGDWSLMCPHECPGLDDCWGEEFEKLYESYESKGRARRVVKAHKLWFAILEAQSETGTPYMVYKDHCNRKSNQQVRCGHIHNLNVRLDSLVCTKGTNSISSSLNVQCIRTYIRPFHLFTRILV